MYLHNVLYVLYVFSVHVCIIYVFLCGSPLSKTKLPWEKKANDYVCAIKGQLLQYYF